MSKTALDQFRLVCSDISYDVDLLLEVVTSVLREKRVQVLAPNREEWVELQQRRDGLDALWKRVEKITGRSWTYAEAVSLWQVVDEKYADPVRTPVSLEAQLQLLFNREQTCALCGAQGLDMIPEIDHRKPARRGGSSAYRNLQWLCRPCNRHKYNKVGREWGNV